MNGYEDYAATGADAAPADMYDPYSESKPFPSYHSDYPEDDYASRRGGGRGRGDRGGRGGGRRGGGDRDRGGGPFRRGGGGGGGRGGRGRPEKPAVSTKLYVTSLPDTCRRSDLIKLFEEYGRVVECDIVKHYAFIHFATQDEAKAAADGLNGHEFQGSSLKVELSISRVRQKPGMGGPNECYKCGKGGHWSKDCPTDRSSSRRSSRPLPYPEDDYYDRPPPPDPYYRDPYYRDRYPPPPHERYRPYADPYERRRYPPPPPYEDPYYRDPYARPPPEVYSRPPVARDPYYDYEDPYAASYQPHAAPFAAPQLAAPSYMAPHAEEAAQAQPAV